MRRPVHARTSHLPAQVTPLVGREREVEEACCRLTHGETRLLTFTGPAGIGKTRLALELAAALVAAGGDERSICPDGAYFVDLSPLTDPDLVPSSIARALHLGEVSERTPLMRVIASLRHRRALLVLDNFEQILPAAPLVAELLAFCPGLTVVATSRAPLHLYGEHDFAVLPLAVPPDLADGSAVSPEAVLVYPAVQLFVQRARAVSRLFTLTEENAATVARLCARLDGLPLAIELAATRTKLLTPAAMLERLDGGDDPAPAHTQDRPARHQTLDTAIGWSYRLLSCDEQWLFRRLGICSGGFSRSIAAALIAGDQPHVAAPHAGVDHLLASLVDQSLVQAMPREGDETRFSMLETIRVFALKELAAHGEQDRAAERHAAHFTDLAESASFVKPQQALWLARLDLEHDNLRAALRWTLAYGMVERAVRLVSSLWWFWCRRGYLDEGRAWMEAVLARLSPPRHGVGDASMGHGLRARVLNAAGAIAWYQGDHRAALAWLEEALSRMRDRGDRGGVAHALMFLGLVALRQNHLREFRTRFEESIAIRRALGDRWGTAMALTAFAGVPLQAGDFAEARAVELESAALFREAGDRWSLTMPLLGLGLQAYYQGDYDRARTHLEEVLALRREVGDTWYTATTLHSLGEVARASGDLDRALALYRESLTTPRALGNSKAVAQCLASIASIAHAAGQREAAARLVGAAHALFDESAIVLPPIEQAQYDRDLAAMRETMGEAAFCAAFGEGRTLTLASAVQQALDLSLRPVDSNGSARGRAPEVLTRREREVAMLIARGMTNRQIARALTITEGTAGSHVEHMLAKLGFQSRSQIAAWAVAQGLLDGAA